MGFDGYYQKIKLKVSTTYSLEALIFRRKRINIGIAGLSYKMEHGCLVPHSYTAFRENHKEKNNNVNDTEDVSNVLNKSRNRQEL